MKKRIFATAMCVALIATVLTACGGKDGKNENTTEEVTTTEVTTEVTTEEVKDTEESTEVKPTETEESTDVTPTGEGSTGAKDDGTSSTDNVTVGQPDEMVEDVDITDDGEVLDTRVSYTYNGHTYQFPAAQNDYVDMLVNAGYGTAEQLAGAYIYIDGDEFLIHMNASGSGEVFDVGVPGGSDNLTSAQMDTFNSVYFDEYNAYLSGSKHALDLDGDGSISRSECYICAAVTCGLNFDGAIFYE